MNTTQPLNLDTAPLTAAVMGKCRICKSPARSVKAEMCRTRCTCGGAVAWKLLKITVRDTVKCDLDCIHAKSAVCTCSCGGDNHGRGHAHP